MRTPAGTIITTPVRPLFDGDGDVEGPATAGAADTKSAGVAKLAPERHYGLALVLGGGEVTMEELARLYAMLTNAGELRTLRYTRDAPPSDGVRSHSRFETLRHLPHALHRRSWRRGKGHRQASRTDALSGMAR